MLLPIYIRAQTYKGPLAQDCVGLSGENSFHQSWNSEFIILVSEYSVQIKTYGFILKVVLKLKYFFKKFITVTGTSLSSPKYI